MSLKELFGGKSKDIDKIIEESEPLGEVTVDCPAIIELKQDKELNKELNLKVDENFYNLEDIIKFFNFKNGKTVKGVVKIENDKIIIVFPEGKLELLSDLSVDWG